MIIVSLTTIHSRLRRLDEVLVSLLKQSKAADVILLNVSRDAFLLDTGISQVDLDRCVPSIAGSAGRILVNFVENTGSYRKIIPALTFSGDPDDIIVTADDDIPYPSFWLQRLVDHVTTAPVTPAYRCREFTWDGNFLRPYEQWPLARGDQSSGEGQPRLDLLPTSGAGIAYRREYFEDGDPLDALRRIAPMQDDIALRLLMLSKGVRVQWVASDAAARGYKFRSHQNDLQLYSHNGRIGWMGRTPNDDALLLVAKFLAPVSRDSHGRGLLEQILRKAPLRHQIRRRIREVYWELRRGDLLP